MSSSRKFTLKSSDGEAFEVDKAVALESQTLKHVIEVDCVDNGIPLPNVTSKILSKVTEYCKKHVETPKSDDRPSSADDDLKSWDAGFVKVDQAILYDPILAANYLNIKNLLDLTCQTVAAMIKGKTPEEIRKTFNIKNDLHQRRRRRFGERTSGLLNRRKGVQSISIIAFLCWTWIDVKVLMSCKQLSFCFLGLVSFCNGFNVLL